MKFLPGKPKIPKEVYKKAEEILSKTRAQIIYYDQFTGLELSEHKIEFTDEVDTAMIDITKKKIFINPQFFVVGYDKYGINFTKFVLYHEIFHRLQLCDERASKMGIEKNPNLNILWNIAADNVVNWSLTELVGLPNAKTFKLYYDPEIGWNYEGKGEEIQFYQENRYKGWTTEEVFKDLVKREKTGEIKKRGGDIGPVETPEGPIIPVDDVITPDEEGERIDEWVRKEIEEIREKMHGIVRIPVNLLRFLEKLVFPKISWKAILFRYIKEGVTASGMYDFTWYPPNEKLFATYGIYMPRMRGEKLKAVVAVDCSGSITEEEFNAFINEVFGICRTFGEYEILVIVTDDVIQTTNPLVVEEPYIKLSDRNDYQIIRTGQKPSKKLWREGGGTDYKQVFILVEKLRFNPNVLVYFTDLACSLACFPEFPPRYPVIWVCSQPEEKVEIRPPFGKIIFLSREEIEALKKGV